MPRSVYFINTVWETPWSCCLSLTIVSIWVSYQKYLKLANLYKKVPLMALAPLGHPFIRYFQNTLILCKLW